MVGREEENINMIVSELKIYNFRRFKSVNGLPGLKITFHKGLNALIGENDSGKTAVIDALKLVLLTESNEYIRPVDDDFYKSIGGEACSEFKIDCTITEFAQNEAKNFIEYLTFKKNGDNVEYMLELHYRAWKEGHKIFQELRVGDIEEGISIDGKARDLLKAVYLKPLRDAEREMSSGRSSRISQILLSHPVFKDKKEHMLREIFQEANEKIENYFTDDVNGKHILQTIRNNLESFNDKGQASNAELRTSDIQLKAILESLSLNAPELNPGLGELNLLFIAAELLLLKDDIDGGMKLALVEELEAHLHPQAQLRLISYLQNEYNENNVQIIISTHSPILASKINLKNLILMKSGSEDFHKSVHYGKKILNAREYISLTEEKIIEANQEMEEENNQWNDLPDWEKAYEIYNLMLDGDGKSSLKAIVAQCLASVLRWKMSVIPEQFRQEKMFDLDLYRMKIADQKKAELKSMIERDQFLSYIVKAIKYAAGEAI